MGARIAETRDGPPWLFNYLGLPDGRQRCWLSAQVAVTLVVNTTRQLDPMPDRFEKDPVRGLNRPITLRAGRKYPTRTTASPALLRSWFITTTPALSNSASPVASGAQSAAAGMPMSTIRVLMDSGRPSFALWSEPAAWLLPLRADRKALAVEEVASK
jgi:hypothetical protein